MNSRKLKKQSPALAALFTACGYTTKQADEVLANWRVVKVPGGVRVEDGMRRKRK